MIRCSHCGKLVQAGATNCQSCGMPLTTANSGAGQAGQGQAEQQELPAWLESLRVHERPVANNSGAQPFTMAELVDENSTPSWMRQDQSRLTEAGASDAFPAIPSGSNPIALSANLEASSLVDQQSLPSWMREAHESSQQAEGQGFSASSLVQQDALPSWMKNLAPTAEAQMPAQAVDERYGLPRQAPTQIPTTPPPGNVHIPQTPQPSASAILPPAPPSVGYNEPTAVPGFLAHSLVDQQAMPEWMKGIQGSGGSGASGPLGAGFAAGELIDQRTLPHWMKDQSGHEKVDPASAMGVPVDGSGQRMGLGQGVQDGVGLPASTLVDKNALPTWMSQDEQRGAGGSSAFEQGIPPSGMAAGSLIDMNAMPTWMKNMEPAQPKTGTRGGPTRSEGMRVPSRPRGDVQPQGQSVAAANAFSSMLGVSASAPLLQEQNVAQEYRLGTALGQQSQQVQPNLSAWPSAQQGLANQNGQVWSSSQPGLANQSGQVWSSSQPGMANQSGQAWSSSQPGMANQSGQAWSSSQPGMASQSGQAWSSSQPGMASQSGQAWSSVQPGMADQSGQAWSSVQPGMTDQSGQAWSSVQPGMTDQSGQAWQTANSPLSQGNWMGAASVPAPLSNNAVAGGQPASMGDMQPYAGYGSNAEANRGGLGQAALSGQGEGAESTKKKSVFDAIRDFFFH